MVVFGCYYPSSFAFKAEVFQTKYEEVGDFKEDQESLVLIHNTTVHFCYVQSLFLSNIV